jgi:hypothetical protein
MPSGSDSRGPGKNSGAKSAKAIKAAKKKSGGAKAKGGVSAPRHIPWLTIGASAAVLALVAILAVNLVPKYQAKEEAQRYAPSAENPDPSVNIDGVLKVDYPAGIHIQPTQRVAYDQSPPFGGPHDAIWATCTGTVYANAIRTENAVHSLEHGAVWVAYNPDTLSAEQVETLQDKVDGQSYTLMSPYPGLDSPISLQSWGHQLKLDSADDERIEHLPGGRCQLLDHPRLRFRPGQPAPLRSERTRRRRSADGRWRHRAGPVRDRRGGSPVAERSAAALRPAAGARRGR